LKNVGIVGMPNAGKSTIFNILTGQSVPMESYPFCTVDPNTGFLVVEDERVVELARMEGSKKIVHPFIEVVDIAGLVKGASKGEGLGNRFLDHISKVDLIVHVVRCFFKDTVSHPMGSIDPVRDAEIVDIELIMKDLETIEKRMEKREKVARAGDEKAREEMEALARLKKHLSKGNKARTFERRNDFEEEIIRSLFLLTDKPVVYVLNVDEKCKEDLWKPLEGRAKREGNILLKVNAGVEYDLLGMPEEEAEEFRKVYDIEGDFRKIFFESVLKELNLIRFLTATEKEARSWVVENGITAYEAAGIIHSDIQKGFIKAEVIQFSELKKIGSMKKARELGALEIHGKDYMIKEGDVVHFLFHS